MKYNLIASLTVLLLAGCAGGVSDDPAAELTYGNWATEYRSEGIYFKQHRCLAKTRIDSNTAFGFFELAVEWDHRDYGLPYGKPAIAFGMKIESLNTKALKFGTERVSTILRFSSGFELKRTFGNIDDRGLGDIDLGPELKALLLEQIDKSHSVEIILESGEKIGPIDLQSLPPALRWAEQCAIEHARY